MTKVNVNPKKTQMESEQIRKQFPLTWLSVCKSDAPCWLTATRIAENPVEWEVVKK